MSLYKQAKDQFIRLMLGKDSVPIGLIELNRYFRMYEPIQFREEEQEDGSTVAISENFRYGSIVTSGKDQQELDENVKDAILTAFEVPSSYPVFHAVHQR